MESKIWLYSAGCLIYEELSSPVVGRGVVRYIGNEARGAIERSISEP